MEVPSRVRLSRCDTGEEELANIETLSREVAKDAIDKVWWTSLGPTLRDPEDEPDRKWQWREIISVYHNKPYFRAKCVRSRDGIVQAAMLFRVDAKSAFSPDQGAVFVDRLATAPQNRELLVPAPVFRGGGTGLLLLAVAQSYSLGFGGRVNLIPVAHVGFYSHWGFEATTVQLEDGVLFELPAETAREKLAQRGLIDG